MKIKDFVNNEEMLINKRVVSMKEERNLGTVVSINMSDRYPSCIINWDNGGISCYFIECLNNEVIDWNEEFRVYGLIMKIYTVLSNHYDYYSFTDWIMTTTSLEEVNSYLDDIKLRDHQISINVPIGRELQCSL